jgi:hypothetical protein
MRLYNGICIYKLVSEIIYFFIINYLALVAVELFFESVTVGATPLTSFTSVLPHFFLLLFQFLYKIH